MSHACKIHGRREMIAAVYPLGMFPRRKDSTATSRKAWTLSYVQLENMAALLSRARGPRVSYVRRASSQKWRGKMHARVARWVTQRQPTARNALSTSPCWSRSLRHWWLSCSRPCTWFAANCGIAASTLLSQSVDAKEVSGAKGGKCDQSQLSDLELHSLCLNKERFLLSQFRVNLMTWNCTTAAPNLILLCAKQKHFLLMFSCCS